GQRETPESGAACPRGHIARSSRPELAKRNGTRALKYFRICRGSAPVSAMRGGASGRYRAAVALRATARAALLVPAVVAVPAVALAAEATISLPPGRVIGTSPLSP